MSLVELGSKWFLTVGLLAAVVIPMGSSRADADPNLPIDPVITNIQPALPGGVTVRAIPAYGEELVVSNPTSTPLDIIGRDGVAFVRVDASGVLANVANPDWYLSNDPQGATGLPSGVQPGSSPHWARVSTSGEWAWFDPRMQAPAALPPALSFSKFATTLAHWVIPVRFGATPIEVSGDLVYRPVLGAFRVETGSVPGELQVSPLQGRIPGLLVNLRGAHTVTIAGVDGGPFLRLSSSGVEVDQGSPSWRDDRQARGEPAPPVGASGWSRLSGSPSVSWLDRRLAYPGLQPPRPAVAQVVQHWSMPVMVDGVPARVEGLLRWIPNHAVGGSRSAGAPTWLFAGVGAVVVVAFGWWVGRRRAVGLFATSR
jgi:hypothetical protein